MAVRGAVRAAVEATLAPILEKEASEAILPLQNARRTDWSLAVSAPHRGRGRIGAYRQDVHTYVDSEKYKQ